MAISRTTRKHFIPLVVHQQRKSSPISPALSVVLYQNLAAKGNCAMARRLALVLALVRATEATVECSQCLPCVTPPCYKDVDGEALSNLPGGAYGNQRSRAPRVPNKLHRFRPAPHISPQRQRL